MAGKSDQIASLFASVGFKIDQRSIQSLNKSLVNIENRVNKLRQSMLGVRAGKNYGDAFKGLERQATRATTALDRIHKEYKSGLSPLQAYTTATHQLTAAFFQLRGIMPTKLPTVPRVRGGVGGGVSGSKTARSGFWGDAARGFAMGGPMGFLGTTATTVGAGVAAAGYALLKGIPLARELQANELAFSAITGSEAGGKSEYNYLRKFSNTYGLGFSDTAEGYKKILASSVGTKLEGENAKQIFEGVSLYGKTLGLDPEKMGRAMTAISQMISKGKVSSEELKGQLAEALPTAVQTFAQAMNMPVDKMFKMMEDGKLLADDVLPRVAKLLKEQADSGGALEKAMANSASAQARFTNKWGDFVRAIYENGLDKTLSIIFNTLTKILDIIINIPGPIWAMAAAFGAVRVGMMALPFAMFIKNMVIIEAMMAGSFGAAALARLSAFATAFKAAFIGMGRFLFLQFFPLLVIFDTIEALATGKKGLLGVGLENLGVTEKVGEWATAIQDKLGINSYYPNAEDTANKGAERWGGKKPTFPKPKPAPTGKGTPAPVPVTGHTFNFQINGNDREMMQVELDRALQRVFEISPINYPDAGIA